jgi:hypothetical protein
LQLPIGAVKYMDDTIEMVILLSFLGERAEPICAINGVKESITLQFWKSNWCSSTQQLKRLGLGRGRVERERGRNANEDKIK